MKTIFHTTLLLLLTLCGGQHVTAQQDTTNRYVVLTKKIQQLEPILQTAESLREADGANFGDFQVILCGKEVVGLTGAGPIMSFRERAARLGVKLVACGFSLKKFNVDPAALPDDIHMVENGILYNFQLQQKGYLSLGL